MAFKSREQFLEAVDKGRDILITFRKDWNVDGVASALALASILEARKKNVEVVADGFTANSSLSFLRGTDRIRSEFGKLQKFVISLDVGKTQLEELSYDLKDDKLHIYVTPKSGQFAERDVVSSPADYKYDLIITLDTPDHAALGSLFTNHSDLFFNRPVINIDHDAGNEQYGNINLTDITSTSCAETIYRLFNETGEHALDEHVATALLAGIIHKTRSFKTSNVTPKTLDTASALVAAGARRDEIVQHLYRSRNLPTLKLWGRALARLQHDPVSGTAWTVLLRQDFVHAGANEEYLADVIHELIVNAPEAEIVSLIYEQPARNDPGKAAGVCALVSSERHNDSSDLVATLRPEGDRKLARICFTDKDIMSAEKSVLEAIRKSLGKQNAPPPKVRDLR